MLTMFENTGQSRTAGKDAVHTIMALRASITEYEEEIQRLEGKLSSFTNDLTLEALSSTTTRLETCRERSRKMTTSMNAKAAALGIEGRKDLRRLAGSKYLQLRANAWAAKRSLRDKLRARKYEKERLERSYRNVLNGVS